MRINRYYLFFLFLLMSSAVLDAQMFGQEPIERVKTYDVKHIAINIKVDLNMRAVEGTVMTSITPIKGDFSSFDIDAVGMKIAGVYILKQTSTKEDNRGYEVLSGWEPLKFEYDNKTIKVTADKTYRTGESLIYKVEYSTSDPEKGLYFIQPSADQPQKRYEVWTQGEGEDNRYWFPCYDYPNNKATTEMIITTDKKYETLSNGMLVSAVENANGTKTWYWMLDKPHSSYLVMLAIGNYDIIEDKYLDVPVYTYVPAGTRSWAEKSFTKTADIVKFYSEYAGYKYPWGRFSQIVVQDFIYGGMENTGAVVLTDVSINDDRTPPDYNATNLIAHELAHMWWGDAVTCRNWNEIWLNESFATFFQCLYTEHDLGKDEYDYNVYRNGISSINVDSIVSRKPIYTREGHTTNTYDKGSVVLSMLRNTFGDTVFRMAMNKYITANQFKNVTTPDLIDAFNKSRSAVPNGRLKSVEWFFDEWIYKAGQPEYKASYSYDDNSKQLLLNFSQVQEVDSLTSDFQMPVPVEIITEGSTQLTYVMPVHESGNAIIKVDSKPLCVVFNKGNSVLCKLHFAKPKEDWLYQLTKSKDAIDRITALKGLTDFINDEDVISALGNTAVNDPFWGVRNEIAGMLWRSTKSSAISIFEDRVQNESDSRIKRNYINNIPNFIRQNPNEKEHVLDLLQKVIGSETRSYYVIADGIGVLGNQLPKDKIYDAVIPYINMDSHGDVIRRYTLDALSKCDDARTEELFFYYALKGISTRTRNNAIRGLENFASDENVVTMLDTLLLKYDLHSTKSAMLDVLDKALNRNSLAYIQELMASSNDDRFRQRIKKILDKY